jgi:hypothetical protein
VTTVIFSDSHRPDHAISVSIACSFLAVLAGGTAVAFSLVFLLPKKMVAVIQDLEEVATTLAPNRVLAPHAEEILKELAFLKDVATREFEKRPLTEDEKIRFRAEILDVHAAVCRTMNHEDALAVLSSAMGVALHSASI